MLKVSKENKLDKSIKYINKEITFVKSEGDFFVLSIQISFRKKTRYLLGLQDFFTTDKLQLVRAAFLVANIRNLSREKVHFKSYLKKYGIIWNKMENYD